MDTQQNVIDSAQPAEAAAVEQPAKKTLQRKWIPAAVLGIIFCIAAWFGMVINEYFSMACAVGALILSSLGVMTGRSLWRDLAITCIVASAVLLLVYAIFFFGIRFAVNSL